MGVFRVWTFCWCVSLVSTILHSALEFGAQGKDLQPESEGKISLGSVSGGV